MVRIMCDVEYACLRQRGVDVLIILSFTPQNRQYHTFTYLQFREAVLPDIAAIEADHPNDKWTVGVARNQDSNGNTEFYINLSDNSKLFSTCYSSPFTTSSHVVPYIALD